MANRRRFNYHVEANLVNDRNEIVKPFEAEVCATGDDQIADMLENAFAKNKKYSDLNVQVTTSIKRNDVVISLDDEQIHAGLHVEEEIRDNLLTEAEVITD